LKRLDVDSTPAAISQFDRFMVWLHAQSGWEYITPWDLLIRDIQAEDDYVILELVEIPLKETMTETVVVTETDS
jgi:hypothetical protein